MNKRTLMFLCVVFCMLLSIITPLKVCAVEEDNGSIEQVLENGSEDDNQGLRLDSLDETLLSNPNESNIMSTPNGTPEATSEGTPEATLEVTPEATPEGTPEATPEGTLEATPEGTPEATPEVTPEPALGNDSKSETTDSSTPILRADTPNEEVEPTIVLDETTIIIKRDDSYVVKYHFENTDEEPEVTLTSNDTSVVTVTDKTINGLKEGITKVSLKYTLNDKEYTVELTVKVLPNAQTAKVIISKKDDKGNFLAGATLQILDKNDNNKIVKEWISTEEAFEFELPAGNYSLHEVNAPVGYEIAEDQDIDVIINEPDEYDAGVSYDTSICSDYKGFPSYYVEMPSTPSEEEEPEINIVDVFCINQEWEVPDNQADFQGVVLTPSSIRNYTKQTVYVNLSEKQKMDISDPTLSDQELYDKLLDIIYHSSKAGNDLDDEYTNSELRFITEIALKNYTNALITDYRREANSNQAFIDALIANDIPHMVVNYHTVDYLSHRYRDFAYVPNTQAGEDIFKIEIGKGTSFGQIIASHFNSANNHNGKNDPTIKALVDKYNKLFEYLIRNEDHHPDDMNLYLYSTTATKPGENADGGAYQNLLGVTGYYEEYGQETIEKEVINKQKTVDVVIRKVWDDNDNEDGKRPETVEVELNNGMKVTLSDENDWTGVIEGLPEYVDGEVFTYEWKEVNLPENYILVSSETDNYVTTITNQYVRTFKVTKQWDDGNPDEDIEHLENITITLLANSKEYGTIELSEEAGWDYTFTNLPVYDGETKITYTVREENVPEGYVASYEEDGEVGIIIHNVKGSGDGEPPHENPQTGDNIVLYLITLLISIIGFIKGKHYLKENN